MLNVTGKYIRVFDVEDKGRYVQAKLSTSKKNQDGDYVHMPWIARFVGNATEAAKELQNKDKIEITNGIIENNYDNNNRLWHKVVIFGFRMQE